MSTYKPRYTHSIKIALIGSNTIGRNWRHRKGTYRRIQGRGKGGKKHPKGTDPIINVFG